MEWINKVVVYEPEGLHTADGAINWKALWLVQSQDGNTFEACQLDPEQEEPLPPKKKVEWDFYLLDSSKSPEVTALVAAMWPNSKQLVKFKLDAITKLQLHRNQAVEGVTNE